MKQATAQEVTVKIQLPESSGSNTAVVNQVKWAQRIASLPEDTQKRIAKKYYGGVMPWKEQR